jgi:hypothetical protein
MSGVLHGYRCNQMYVTIWNYVILQYIYVNVVFVLQMASLYTRLLYII